MHSYSYISTNDDPRQVLEVCASEKREELPLKTSPEPALLSKSVVQEVAGSPRFVVLELTFPSTYMNVVPYESI